MFTLTWFFIEIVFWSIVALFAAMIAVVVAVVFSIVVTVWGGVLLVKRLLAMFSDGGHRGATAS